MSLLWQHHDIGQFSNLRWCGVSPIPLKSHRLPMPSPIHSFHIPVMGLAFTIDTPLKVARFGISSVVSLVEDQLLEDMRLHHCREAGKPFHAIPESAEDSRAARTTAYLDLLDDLVTDQAAALRKLPFEPGTDITQYFELLPPSALKEQYRQMMEMPDGAMRTAAQESLRAHIRLGAIDANIMAKVDKDNYSKDGQLRPPEYADAMAALRGFANSKLDSALVLSAGYNPRLYNYLAQFACFRPDENGRLAKRVILKVSDFRSAMVQGKILAKKGVWVSEFRVESGLNCGGHAFATEGLLQGPILEEFRQKRAALREELFELCQAALSREAMPLFSSQLPQRLSVQGGVGTAAEHQFLLDHYGIDSVGWGSPFLLVPEVTTVDAHTRSQLAAAKPEDYYLSHASPLGVPFNNFRPSSSEVQRKQRIEKGRPGSPCYKKFLSSNTEFTDRPICTASRQYQHLKIQQLKASKLPPDELKAAIEAVEEKDCLCEGLSVPASLNNDLPIRHKLTAVTICPGPNLAFFSGTFSLREMVNHIYGRGFLGNHLQRPHVFCNELNLYISYFKNELNKGMTTLSEKAQRARESFRQNLLAGIEYYRQLAPSLTLSAAGLMRQDLAKAEALLIHEAAKAPAQAGMSSRGTSVVL